MLNNIYSSDLLGIMILTLSMFLYYFLCRPDSLEAGHKKVVTLCILILSVNLTNLAQ